MSIPQPTRLARYGCTPLRTNSSNANTPNYSDPHRDPPHPALGKTQSPVHRTSEMQNQRRRGVRSENEGHGRRARGEERGRKKEARTASKGSYSTLCYAPTTIAARTTEHIRSGIALWATQCIWARSVSTSRSCIWWA
ncbi:hypothetical protein RSAG8_00187, partial [Rhizoctonia solani AG-8 WAC10335]